MILITGHQRSGTGYMAGLCRAHGFRVGHEQVLEDGVSSFQFAVNTNLVPFHSIEQNKGRKHYKFDLVIHVVRHPLKVIASTAYTDMNGAIEWQANFCQVDLHASRIRQAVQTYIGWNRIAERRANVRIPVERADEELPIALRMYEGTGEHEREDPPPKDYNARQHDAVTWSDIRHEVTPREFADLWIMADRYGYDRCV